MRRPIPQQRRIVLIASSRYPVSEPFAGGLEAQVALLTKHLRRRGHTVRLYAAPGSSADLGATLLPVSSLELSDEARRDVSMPAPEAIREHHAYLSLMMDLAGDLGPNDVVFNNSLHYLPIAMASLLPCPMVTTLHTPPTPWLESAIRIDGAPNVSFAAVSRHTAAAWRSIAGTVDVVPNGIDLDRWHLGPGGPDLVWSGRIVPEKAPHLAVQAVRLLGRRLTLAGPIVDRRYYDEELRPHLNNRIRYAGHLEQSELDHLVGRSAVALVTPAWDEPFGLVAAEALACGTPVAAFARGGLSEVVDTTCGRLARAGDVAALADAITAAEGLDRTAARLRAERHCSADRMVQRYEQLFDALPLAA